MSALVVGVIGHVDHGKTALVRALTGEETDRLAEEKARGISIALGFARLQAADRQVDLIDMPGHERFIRTMIAGATGIGAVLLVLAANEGIKPQTIEHVEIAGLLGLRRAVLAVSKADLVSPEQAAAAAAAGVRLLMQAGFELPPPVLTSVPRDTGITALRQVLLGLEAGPAEQHGFAMLPVDRAFAVAGHGPVVTGTLRGAAVAAGDALELFPARATVRVRGVQSHGAGVASAAPGQRVALNLRDVEIAGLGRGMVLAAPGMLVPSDWLTVTLRAVAGAPALKNGMVLRALFGTAESDIRLRLLDRDVLEPGESGFAQLHFAAPVACAARAHVVLRLVSPARTVAGGMILEPVQRRQRRHAAPALARLAMLARLEGAALVAAELAGQGAAGTSLQALSRLSALAPGHVGTLLAAQPVHTGRAGLVVALAAFEAVCARIIAVLAARREGLAPGKLLAALPETSAAVLDEAIAVLLARQAIARHGAQLVLPRPDEALEAARDEAALAARIEALLRGAALSPPDPKTIVTSRAAKRAVDRLLREGVVIRAVDRAKDREILFHQEAVEDAMRRLAPLLESSSGLLATDIGAALGISRKYTMPLLDHLDTIRFTRRINDRRLRGAAVLSSPAPNV